MCSKITRRKAGYSRTQGKHMLKMYVGPDKCTYLNNLQTKLDVESKFNLIFICLFMESVASEAQLSPL